VSIKRGGEEHWCVAFSGVQPLLTGRLHRCHCHDTNVPTPAALNSGKLESYFLQVAVKIINHSKDCSQIQDIRVLRETLFSTSLLHPNIVVRNCLTSTSTFTSPASYRALPTWSPS
jgi:hypothetical protein